MAFLFHQPIRRPIFWAVVITLFLFIQSLAHAAQVTIAWDPNDPVPDGYRVFQRIEGQNFDYSSPVWPRSGDDPTQTTCTLDNLADGTSYYFVVRAYVGSDESGDSNEINHITDAVEPDVYTITTDAGPGGSISPESTTFNAGDSQTFSISASVGYHITDVLVDGGSIGSVSAHTFTQIDGDHVITAVFSVNRYIISAFADGSGTISPSGSINIAHGGNQTYTITPDSGFGVADVLVDGQSVGSNTSITFTNVTAPHTIRAIFESSHHVISATAGPNGTITPSGQTSVANGQSRSFTMTPNSGYRLADVVVDGASAGALTPYTFPEVTTDHTIEALFVADTYTIDASSHEGGSISPNGHISVVGMSEKSFTVTADVGYEIDDLIVDGVSLGAQESHTFSRINADHTIMAMFRAVNQPPTADAGPDQVVDEQALVSLNGLNSKDLDDGIATFEWRQVNGALVALSALSDEIVTFTAPDVDVNGEALEFELTVTDISGEMATDRCIVNVTWVNEAPVAKTGPDQSVNEGSTVVLNAADSMDPDDGIDRYQWRQVQGPEVVLLHPDSVAPSFSALDVGPQGASLAFELTVTDAGGLQDTDHCMITVTWDNMEPLADAGPDNTAAAGETVVLDGSGSMDPDGLNLQYQWRQTFGQPVTLSDATSVRPQFTAPMEVIDHTELTFELTVTDSGGLHGVDTCQVTIQTEAQPEKDITPPTLTIDKPAQSWAVVFKRQYKLSGSADDDHQIARVEWKNSRGGSGEANGTTQWWKRINLRRGLNLVTITAIDEAGHKTSKEIYIYRIKWSY